MLVHLKQKKMNQIKKYKQLVFNVFFYLLLSLFIINIGAGGVLARPGGGHTYKSEKKKSSSSSTSSSNTDYSTTNSYSSSSNSDYSDDNDTERPGYNGNDWYSGDGRKEPMAWWEWVLAILSPVLFWLPFHFIAKVLKFFDKMNERKSTALKSVPKKKKVDKKDIDEKLIDLKKQDPNFSKTLFFDFAASLFNKYYSWQSTSKYANLKPFFSDLVENQAVYKEVVIGSINIENIDTKTEAEYITLEFDANYTREFIADEKQFVNRYLSNEKWLFKRNAGLQSPEPKKMQELACPSCGANANFTDVGKCKSCGELVKNGELNWYVSKITRNRKQFETKGLANYAEEIGTDYPTIKHFGVSKQTAEFAQKHEVNWGIWLPNFEYELVKPCFKNIYQAWSENNLLGVRNLLSDRLYESFNFWIENYKNEGLTNKLVDVKVQKTEFVNLEMDKYYEAITLRIFASCFDYVTDESGKVLGGSKTSPREFSEYWTFVRRAGVEKDAYDFGTCPNCGAPADKITGQSGVCEYCNSKISNGDFSWVLAVITQDEVYKG